MRKYTSVKEFIRKNITFLLAALLVLFVSPAVGHACALNENRHGIDWMGALDSFGEFGSAEYIDTFIAVAGGEKYEVTGAAAGFALFAAIIAIAYFSPKKRDHRKGVEHGSAHWGTEEEKRIIRDNFDFFNNAIIASDVFLVINRKKRDENEKKQKNRKNGGKDEEQKRHDALIADIEFHSPQDETDIDENKDDKTLTVRNGRTVIGYNKKGVILSYYSDSREIIVPQYIKQDESEKGRGTKITAVGEYAFLGCKNTEAITLPESVKSIGKCAFTALDRLVSVSAYGAVSIGASAFEDCTALSEMHLSGGLRKVGDNAFKSCSQLDFYCPSGSSTEKYAAENYIYCIDKKEAGKESTVTAAQVINSAKRSQKIKPMLNLNMIVLGGSGTGKSRFFVKPNLMQCNTSFVVTDPSGELLESCGKMLERKGYKIKVFNIDNMSRSHNYNPFHYLKEYGSDKPYKPENVTKMINTFMINTKGEGQGADPFWDNATEIFLSAVIFLILENFPENEWNWARVLDIVHRAEVDSEKKNKSELDEMFDYYREVVCKKRGTQETSLALKSYKEFTQAAGETMQSILINTTARLKNFKLQEVINLTSTDKIELDKLGDEKTALFIIIPSTDTTYNYLAAMMYTQLFDSLYSVAIHKYHGALKVPVRCILDEFANVGKIPEFDKVLATCRKFDISAVVILQNLSQLKRIYEKSWEELPGNCDSLLYLGGKDQFTNEYLMKSLGKETIDTTSINKSKGKQGSTSYNDNILGRELLQLNELETMDNSKCIVMIRGLNPFFTDKFEIKNHENYNMLSEVNMERNFYNIDENIKPEEPETVVDIHMTDDNSILNSETGEIKLTFISSENEKVYTETELNDEIGITDEAVKMFETAL